MQVNANWCVRTLALSAVLAFVFMALSCGGGSTSNIGLEAAPTYTGDHDSSNAIKGTGLVVHESEIASLPRWQQEMLSDPGWNQPYIPPAEDTQIEGPTTELLLRLSREKLEANVTVTPRGFTPGGKSASWNNNPTLDITLVPGEYDGVARDATPPFGCNTNGGNGDNDNGIEDLIAGYPTPSPNPVSYVISDGIDLGWAKSNYFCEGGAGNDMYSAIYQLFADDASSSPDDMSAEWVELSYNSGVLGAPVGPLGVCGAEAFSVTGPIWRRFNADIDALPSMAPTKLYNILIAPAEDVIGPETSFPPGVDGGSTGYHQPFYFGSVGNCYGEAWIVTIESTTSECENYASIFTSDPAAGQEFYTNPVYGLLLKRWREMSSSDEPWATEFGFPVHGPFAYANGVPVLSGKGQYYAWGMWYEKGFMWWIDYDNEGVAAQYPNATDETQTYVFTGDNVYCGEEGDADYIKMPTVFYGGAGDLGVSVSVQAQRRTPADAWLPVEFTGTQYNVALADAGGEPGLDVAELSLFAQGNGGTTDVDCNYKYYVWALRNGSIIGAGTAFDAAQRFVPGGVAQYGSPLENKESIYVVRVQVTDADDNIAYGDSFPIHVGHGASGTTGDFAHITIINNDLDGNWPTNLEAITGDLDLLSATLPDLRYSVVDYYPGVGEDAFDADVKVAVWYHGGPMSTAGEPMNQNAYTVEEAEDLASFRTNGVPLLNFSQSAGIWDNTNWDGPSYHYLENNVRQFNSIFDHTLPSGWTTTDFAEGILGLYDYKGFDTPPWSGGSTCTTIHGDLPGGGNYYFGFGPFQRVLGEGYIGTGSSGNSYNANGYNWNNASLGQTVRAINTVGEPRNPLDMPGAQRGIGDYGFTFRSWGNSIAMSYFVGYAWADLNVYSGSPITPTREENLQNILASLDSAIFTYGDGGSGGGYGGGGVFTEYDGADPAIVMTKPLFFADDGTLTDGFATYPGTGLYPDSTGIDVFRSTDDLAVNNEIMRTAGNGDEDGLNGNDIDMQAPFYGYHHYGLDGATDTGPDASGTPTDSDDDVMWAGGVLVHNPDFDVSGDTDWRLNPGDPGTFGNPAGSRLVSGWYYNNSMQDPSIHDGRVSAFYGNQTEHMSFDGRDGSISFEAIARWAPTGMLPNGLEGHGALPARLRWCLYPGHGVIVPDAGAGYPEYGRQLSWKQFLQDHDIDNDGDSGGFRDEAGYLRPSFTFGGNDSLTDGRILDFDYRNIMGWYTDFSGNFVHGDMPDGTTTPGDKFPYRARLITGWTAYLDNTQNQTTWPNRMPDPGSFIELGGYIVDTSAGDPGVQIVDDPEEDDPYLTFSADAYPDFTADFFYEIIGGTAPYEVTLDPAYDLLTYDPLNPLGTFDDAGLAVSWTDALAGMNEELGVMWTDPDGGDRIFALKVRDENGTGPNQDMFWYADTVAVGPPMSVAILNDPMSANDNAFNNLVADIAEIYGASVITTFDLGASDLAVNDLAGFDGVMWASDYPLGTGTYGTNLAIRTGTWGFSFGSGMANLNEVVRFVTVEGGTAFVASPKSCCFTFNAQNTSWNPVGNMEDVLSFANGYFYDGYSSTSRQFNFIDGSQNTPNSMFGWDAYIATRVGRGYNSCMGPLNTYWEAHEQVKSVDGYSGGSTWHAGGYRTDAGAGKCVQLLGNYGDIDVNQNDGHTRGEGLQNLLCMAGNNLAPWDPDYVPPEPSTILYFDDMDGGATGGATWSAQNNVGSGTPSYTDTWTVYDGAADGFGTSNGDIGGNAYHYGREGGFTHTGNYGNNMRNTLYWGPMDFTAETDDPILWVRVYTDQESSGTSWDRVWFGWSNNSTHEWANSYSASPSWEASENIGDQLNRSAPVLYDFTLAGAAGQSGVYATFYFSSDGSVDWYAGTWLDNFTVTDYGLEPEGI